MLLLGYGIVLCAGLFGAEGGAAPAPDELAWGSRRGYSSSSSPSVGSFLLTGSTGDPSASLSVASVSSGISGSEPLSLLSAEFPLALLDVVTEAGDCLRLTAGDVGTFRRLTGVRSLRDRAETVEGGFDEGEEL